MLTVSDSDILQCMLTVSDTDILQCVLTVTDTDILRDFRNFSFDAVEVLIQVHCTGCSKIK